jgi:hypothetical protein
MRYHPRVAVEPEKAPIVAVIGLAWILGSAVLAWLSSPATLHLTRDNEDRVAAVIEARLFGLVLSQADRVEGIRSASLGRPGEPGQSTQTTKRLVFETRQGPVDLGRNQQLFAVDYADIDGFFKTSGPSTLTLSSISRGSELRRFVIAQAIAVFLCLGGLGLGWMLISGLRAG